jgi:subtilase family serine protease
VAGLLLVAGLWSAGCGGQGDSVMGPDPVATPTPAAITGRPDLTISNLNFSPGSPKAGDEITFWVFVRNAGDAAAAPSTLRFKVGGEGAPPETAVPALNPGQEYQHERRVTLTTAQNYTLTATADARSQVAESNEGNNVHERTITVASAPVPGRPDLTISNLNISPASPRAGEEITFWVYVRNVGDAVAPLSTLRFAVAGESPPPETAIPALAPGLEYHYQRRVTLTTAQNYTATATADARAQVTESDETNNVRTRTFTVAP